MTIDFSSGPKTNRFLGVGAVLALLVFTGCDQPKIAVYRVPKEQAAPASAHGHGESMPRSQAKLSWTLPAGWQEGGSARMSLASFTILGEDGKEAQVTCTPLPALGGRDVEIINMWRQQAGQPELSAEEAGKQLQPVEVAGEAGKLFEVTSKTDGTNAALSIVTAMMHRPDASWFFKLSGDVAIVEAQKPAFIAFLKSVQIQEAPMSAAEPGAAPMAAASPSPARFKWQVPASWQAVTPGQMQAAKFSVPSNGAAKADVAVSIFPSDTGGMRGNVTRWRGQIELSEISEADLAKIITPLDPKDSRSVMVDMTNNGKQLIGAIVPRGGQWFFYKLLGDEAAVTPQKDAFVAFVKSEP